MWGSSSLRALLMFFASNRGDKSVMCFCPKHHWCLHLHGENYSFSRLEIASDFYFTGSFNEWGHSQPFLWLGHFSRFFLMNGGDSGCWSMVYGSILSSQFRGTQSEAVLEATLLSIIFGCARWGIFFFLFIFGLFRQNQTGMPTTAACHPRWGWAASLHLKYNWVTCSLI